MTRHKERIQQTTFEKIYPTHHLDCIKTKKLKTQQKEKKKGNHGNDKATKIR